jgi:hypothetical protein
MKPGDGMKPAFFYNAEIRNNGTPRRVFEAAARLGWRDLGLKRYNRPLLDVDFSSHDFWLFIDDGRDDIDMEVPETGVSACWLVDTHLGYETRLDWAKKFDFIFTAQKDAAVKMQSLGLNAHWLPLACLPNVDPNALELSPLDKAVLGPYGLQRVHDVVFVGHLNQGSFVDGSGNNRVEYLDHIFKAFPNSWFSQSVFFEQAAIRYARGRVGFNVSIKHDLNMRVFEVMSTGICLVTDYVADLEELGFKDEVHYLGYDGKEDAVEKIEWALKNPMEREKIAKAGHRLVREKHTYQDRIKQIIETVGV